MKVIRERAPGKSTRMILDLMVTSLAVVTLVGCGRWRARETEMIARRIAGHWMRKALWCD